MLGPVYQTALSGLRAAETAIDVTANNLANSMTDGYKASRVVFSDQTPQSHGSSSGGNPVQVGRGVSVAAVDTDFSQGVLSLSDNPLHLALEGDGFFVQQAPDGGFAYSREGAFRLNADGELVDADGHRVMGYNADSNFDIDLTQLEPLKPRRGAAGNGATLLGVSVGEDGVLRGKYTDGMVRDLGQVEIAKFSNNQGLIARGRNNYAAGPNSGLPVSGRGAARIRAGSRELSNTDIATELVQLSRYAMMFRVNAAVIRESSELDILLNLRRS